MPANLQQLPKVKESISFIYVEHCRIGQNSMSIEIQEKEGGKTLVPIANTTCLMIGPGTVITHAAIKTISDCGCSIVWCGDHGFRFYAYGMGETRNAKNLLSQAKMCMDPKLHMDVVLKMYALRFGEELPHDINLNKLRGLEGVRMKKVYAQCAEKYGIPWNGRDLGLNKNWNDLEPINKALIYSSKLLYSICSAVIVSLGFSTGLGFIHSGRTESFSFDIADLYKAETTIPASFEAVSIHLKTGENIESLVRKKCRMYFNEAKLMKRIPKDIFWILESKEQINLDPTSYLWNEDNTLFESGSWNLSDLNEEQKT
jgi:CRISPR-associated protein Cas1